MEPHERPPDLHAVARNYADGAVVGEHCHADGQFIHATAGVMEIRADQRLWLIPPQRALWMPPRMPHALRARGDVALRTLYIAPDRASRVLGKTPQSFMVPALIRELIMRALERQAIRDWDCYGHLAGVLFDEIADLDPEGRCLAIPSDPRLARVCARILTQPGDTHRIEDLARQAGASVRTLGRLARHELGCSLSTWRQEARMLSAVPMLIAGVPVTRVAQFSGYATPAAFAATFKRLMGVSPRAYR